MSGKPLKAKAAAETETAAAGDSWACEVYVPKSRVQETVDAAVQAVYRAVQAKQNELAPDSTVKNSAEPIKHSDDFVTVLWFGTQYTFTKTQAACVRILWEAWQRGTPTLSQEAILERAESSATHLRDVFKLKGRGMHPAWGTMITSAGKGRYCLRPPA